MQSSNDRGGRSSQKTLQLCTQVQHALTYALGEIADPVLLDLTVEFVEPMHGDRHLLVGLADTHGHGLIAALAALDGARGYLRTAVAEAVNRGKAPQLSFTLVPAGGAE